MDIIYTLDVLSAAPSGGVPLQDLGIVTNVPKWNDAPTNTILTTNYNITNLGVKHEEVQISEMLNFAITSGHIKLYGNGIEIPDNNASLQIGANETVAASYYCSAKQKNSSSTPINFDTKIDDTHNAVTTGTWKFTAPVSGLYKIGGSHNSASGTGFYIQLYKNGSIHMGNVGYVTSDGTTGYSAQLRLLAGDYIDLRGSSSNTASGGALTAGPARIEISRIN